MKLAKRQNLSAKNLSELRIGCVYLAPYKDPLDVDTFYFRARLEKVYGDSVGCNVKVLQSSPLTVTPSGHGKSVTVTRLSL